jgi:hypothetical protein
MSIGISEFQSSTLTGLGTYTYTIQTAGLYNISATSLVIPPSSVSIVIKQNGSTIATSNTPSAVQQAINVGLLDHSCAANDVISFVVNSSATSDSLPNTTKTLMNIYLNN